MKPRTLELLVDCIDQDLAWRKKELSTIKSSVDGASPSDNRQITYIRCGVALLYAHYEGFVKSTAQTYLKHITYQRVQYSNLTSNLLAIVLKNRISGFSDTRKASTLQEVVDFFVNGMSDAANVASGKAIYTGSNLNSERFREIVWILGLDYKAYETKEKMIDERLLAKRNRVAHGEYIAIDPKGYAELHRSVILILDDFRTQVENSAALKHYKKN